MTRQLCRCGLICGMAALAALLLFIQSGQIEAETCLSPFVKRLDRPNACMFGYLSVRQTDTLTPIPAKTGCSQGHGPAAPEQRSRTRCAPVRWSAVARSGTMAA